MTTAEKWMIICIVIQAVLILIGLIFTTLAMIPTFKKQKELFEELFIRAWFLAMVIAGIGCSLFLILALK